MKNYKLSIRVFAVVLFALLPGVLVAVAPMRSMTLGGATGIITMPTARTGWETGSFGLDFGYHYVSDQEGTHIPKIQFNMFNKWELGGSLDTQVEDGADVLFHTKLRFYPWNKSYNQGGTSLALGGNYQSLKGPVPDPNNPGQTMAAEDSASQLYLAATYYGNFFLFRDVETSFAIGKTFHEAFEGDIDFAMGYNIAVPGTAGYLNWITDYGNFSYSLHAYGAQAQNRGAFNTGVRIDVLKGAGRNLHLKVDVLLLDALDENRSFGGGLVFGMIF